MCILNFVPSKKIVDNLHILDRFLRGWNNFAIKKGGQKVCHPKFFFLLIKLQSRGQHLVHLTDPQPNLFRLTYNSVVNIKTLTHFIDSNASKVDNK